MINIDDLIIELLSDNGSIYNGYIKWDNDNLNFQIKIEIENIANNLGIKLLNKNSFENLMWDGKYLRCQKMTIANILHDIAHFQIALDFNRYLKDYGLSIGPDSNFEIKVSEIPMKKCKLHEQNKLFGNWISYSKMFSTHQLQEIFASVLGILWCRKLKIQTKKILIEHDWCYSESDSCLDKHYDILNIQEQRYIFADIKKFKEIIEDLRSNNFLDEKYYPTYILNH